MTRFKERPGAQQRLDDLQVYKRLINLVEELEQLSKRAWSLSSSTALMVAAVLVRRLASALYRASLRSED
jgi:ribosomal protein S4